ncbi:MAG TPA: ArsR family transcriptional regulator [Chitinophagales bacterium]|nr:ArsR family transcriptional regulator [Chitinophagales bacterium]
MTLSEAKIKFIQAWGMLGTKWGINRTMAQVHALLLITPQSLCADDIMEALNISRGNANMNLRALIDWGLIQKEHKMGERKEYFFAEKDIWKAARQIIIERKRRELEPIKTILAELSNVEDDTEEAIAFKEAITELTDFTETADKALDRVIKTDKDWVLNSLIKMLG